MITSHYIGLGDPVGNKTDIVLPSRARGLEKDAKQCGIGHKKVRCSERLQGGILSRRLRNSLSNPKPWPGKGGQVGRRISGRKTIKYQHLQSRELGPIYTQKGRSQERREANRCSEEPTVEGGRLPLLPAGTTPVPQTLGGWVWVKVSLSVWKQEVRELSNGHCFLCEIAVLTRHEGTRGGGGGKCYYGQERRSQAHSQLCRPKATP